MKRIIGIAFVWLGCTFAWVVLGSTLLVRSESADSTGSGEVHRLWGPPAEQPQAYAYYDDVRTVDHVQTIVDQATGVGREVTTHSQEPSRRAIEVVGSDLHVGLALEHRRRGLNWYPTYTVDFDGTYRFRNDSGEAREVTFVMPIEQQNTVFDGFAVSREGEAVELVIDGGEATWAGHLEAGETRAFQVVYRSRGTERWMYRMTAGTGRTTNFRLEVTTDFDEVDFPEGSLSPTSHEASGDGWRGVWDFDSLIASQPVGIEMPQRLNPGPLAARITFFAPVGMLFFFFVVGILAMARARDLHPMHYFFLGSAFFAFHLLFAYLVDHLPIAASFGISAAASVVLVVTYARLFVGWRFALVQIGISQLLYLVLFSYTFMWEGFTGLSITIGAVLTLFVMMQITGRTPWGAKKDDGPAPTVANPPLPAAPVVDATPKAF